MNTKRELESSSKNYQYRIKELEFEVSQAKRTIEDLQNENEQLL